LFVAERNFEPLENAVEGFVEKRILLIEPDGQLCIPAHICRTGANVATSLAFEAEQDRRWWLR
jgi:hypothetical protein